MKNLIIDAANEKIFFSIITDSQSYTTTYPNSRENFDKFVILLKDFFKENRLNFNEIQNIFVNKGPGKFSSIRISISIAKAISIANNINLYGFSSEDIGQNDYKKTIELFKKGKLIKDLIKPLYSS